jgi:hypothetical protein
MIVIGTEFGLVIVNGLVVGIEKDPVEILLVSIPVQKNRENLVLPMNLLPLHHHRDWSDLRRAHRPAQVQARIARDTNRANLRRNCFSKHKKLENIYKPGKIPVKIMRIGNFQILFLTGKFLPIIPYFNPFSKNTNCESKF